MNYFGNLIEPELISKLTKSDEIEEIKKVVLNYDVSQLPSEEIEKNGRIRRIKNTIIILITLQSQLRLIRDKEQGLKCTQCIKLQSSPVECRMKQMLSGHRLDVLVYFCMFDTDIPRPLRICRKIKNFKNKKLFYKNFDFVLNHSCQHPRFKLAIERLFSNFNPKFTKRVNQRLVRLDEGQETFWINRSAENRKDAEDESKYDEKNPSRCELSSDDLLDGQNLNLIGLMIKRYLRVLKNKLRKEALGKEYDKELNRFCEVLYEDHWNDAMFILIDCRYRYEFDGGHIRGSFNVNDPAVIKRLFFSEQWQKQQKYLDFLNLYRDSFIDIEFANEIVKKYAARFNLRNEQNTRSKEREDEPKSVDFTKLELKKLLKNDISKLIKIKEKTKNLSGNKFLELIKTQGNIIKIAKEKNINLNKFFKNEKQMRRFFLKEDKDKFLLDHKSKTQAKSTNPGLGPTAIFIFFCEFSSERGPKMCNFFRSCDRKFNDYPNLTFPLNYLMKGGYSKFHENYKYFCTPKISTENEHPKKPEKKGRRPQNETLQRAGTLGSTPSFKNLGDKIAPTQPRTSDFQKMNLNFENLLKNIAKGAEHGLDPGVFGGSADQKNLKAKLSTLIGLDTDSHKSVDLKQFMSEQGIFSQKSSKQLEFDLSSISNFAGHLDRISQQETSLHYLNPKSVVNKGRRMGQLEDDSSSEYSDTDSLDSSRYRRMEDVNFLSEFS